MTASAYIFNVPQDRRDTLLYSAEENKAGSHVPVAEPVPRFQHSKRSPLVVFASFQDGKVTHIADGRKGVSAGTDLVRLNLDDLQPLNAPISYETLVAPVPKRFRTHLQRAFEQGGKPAPGTLAALVDAITKIDSTVAARFVRFSAKRKERLRALTPNQRQNMAIQKDTLGVALEIAGLPKEELLSWAPGETPPNSFLDGIHQAYVREDAMLLADFSNFPGFKAIEGATHYAARTFESKDNPRLRLTVFMANKLPLEQQTGADLIYYNETYRAFVLIQYKAMEQGKDGPEFRWKDGDQLALELARMDTMLAELAKVPPDNDPDGYRFCNNPFLLKFCSRVTFDPDDKGLFPGMYIPLDLWKPLASSGRLKGEKDGNVLTYDNVGRRLTNTEFITLVGKSWIGTTIGQSAILEKMIQQILQTGRTVMFAVKRVPIDPMAPKIRLCSRVARCGSSNTRVASPASGAPPNEPVLAQKRGLAGSGDLPFLIALYFQCATGH